MKQVSNINITKQIIQIADISNLLCQDRNGMSDWASLQLFLSPMILSELRVSLTC